MAEETTGEPRQGSTRGRWALPLVGATVVALVAGGIGAAVALWADPKSDTDPSSCRATKTAERGLPSVVTVFASGGGQAGSGTGELVKAGGYILTNEHVINVAANNSD